jgi:hypothetical protein
MPNQNVPKTSPFDRLSGPRRNRKIRNVSVLIAAASVFFIAVLWLDARWNMHAQPLTVIYLLSMLLIASIASAIYYHLRFLTRE